MAYKKETQRERGEGRLESTASLRLTVFESEHNCCGKGDEAIQWSLPDVVRCTSRIESVVERRWKR